jgi:hypothetical protein
VRRSTVVVRNTLPELQSSVLREKPDLKKKR